LGRQAISGYALTVLSVPLHRRHPLELGQAILSRKGIEVQAGHPGMIRSVIGTGLYLAVLGLLALGLWHIDPPHSGRHRRRRWPGPRPSRARAGPAWQTAIAQYLPSAAGQAIIGRTKFAPPGHLLSSRGQALECSAHTRHGAYRRRGHAEPTGYLTRARPL
jgi:hypothetical protein